MSRPHLRGCRGPDEFADLVRIWRSSVDATHHFLAPADRDAIEGGLATDYFPQVRLTVDVNEQNEQAVGFYAHTGFIVTGRSATDGEGRPYRLLHLALRRD